MHTLVLVLSPVLWIHNGFSVDPDPTFYLIADPDPGSQTITDPNQDSGQILKAQKVEF
jgi:hypothetical protein